MLRGGVRQATGSATPLAGRAEELARLEGLLDSVAGGSPGFTVLWGEPGIGKTRC
jgi:predicted ATPase